jgi:hypothetical protein
MACDSKSAVLASCTNRLVDCFSLVCLLLSESFVKKCLKDGDMMCNDMFTLVQTASGINAAVLNLDALVT